MICQMDTIDFLPEKHNLTKSPHAFGSELVKKSETASQKINLVSWPKLALPFFLFSPSCEPCNALQCPAGCRSDPAAAPPPRPSPVPGTCASAWGGHGSPHPASESHSDAQDCAGPESHSDAQDCTGPESHFDAQDCTGPESHSDALDCAGLHQTQGRPCVGDGVGCPLSGCPPTSAPCYLAPLSC